MADSNPLPALNLPTPLHTSFISSTTAQQNNPHIQLRTVDGKPALRDDQIGLIRDLETSPNAPVVVDGVVLNNTTTNGNATEVRFTTPASSITKAFSGGISREDVSKQFGQDPNSTFEYGKTTVDSVIEKNFADIKAAQEAILTAKEALAEDPSEKNQEALKKAEADKVKAEKAYASNRALRKTLENASVAAINNLAYFKKDKNGLVFGKPFDGVYVLQFTDGTRITLHDSAAAGWHYQTFAHYVDPKNGITHGYQSIGDETVGTAMPTSGTATYKGISTAYLTENGKNDRQLTADVTAIADFAKKGIRFTTSNSHFHKLDNKGIRISEKADGYNMKGTASWAADSNTFKGNIRTQNKAMSGTMTGKFYGAQAAEIGGTYGLKNGNNSQQLIGGYGAKRK
ncbi:transferrin-binding protein-like solute binding protein [Neisseria wadsworthii]|nr:transferrin-binding protein-like solute binding protein [Neisseria wadsworthii]